MRAAFYSLSSQPKVSALLTSESRWRIDTFPFSLTICAPSLKYSGELLMLKSPCLACCFGRSCYNCSRNTSKAASYNIRIADSLNSHWHTSVFITTEIRLNHQVINKLTNVNAPLFRVANYRAFINFFILVHSIYST